MQEECKVRGIIYTFHAEEDVYMPAWQVVAKAGDRRRVVGTFRTMQDARAALWMLQAVDRFERSEMQSECKAQADFLGREPIPEGDTILSEVIEGLLNNEYEDPYQH